jgi:hypothetical protein
MNHVSIFDPPLAAAFWPEQPGDHRRGGRVRQTRPGTVAAGLYGVIPVHRGDYDRTLFQDHFRIIESGLPVADRARRRALARHRHEARQTGRRLYHRKDECARSCRLPCGHDRGFLAARPARRTALARNAHRQTHHTSRNHQPKAKRNTKVVRRTPTSGHASYGRAAARGISWRLCRISHPPSLNRSRIGGDRTWSRRESDPPARLFRLFGARAGKTAHIPLHWMWPVLTRPGKLPADADLRWWSSITSATRMWSCCGFDPHHHRWMGKIELSEHWLVGPLFRAYGVIWVHRGKADRKALRAALDGLSQGRMIALAPEGRQSLERRAGGGDGGRGLPRHEIGRADRAGRDDRDGERECLRSHAKVEARAGHAHGGEVVSFGGI